MDAADERLVENFRKMRNPNNFKPLVQRFQSRLYNIAYRMTGNYEEAEEMVQETFLRVYTGFDRLNKSSYFYAWVLSIINNLCRDLLRVRQRHCSVQLLSLDQIRGCSSVAEPSNSKGDPAREFEELEQTVMIGKSLARLPCDQRMTLVLHDIEGLPYQQIADITGVNLGTVRSRLHYARLKLRIMLEPYLAGRALSTGLTAELCPVMQPVASASRRQT